MKNFIEISETELKTINGGAKEWVLLGWLISPALGFISTGIYNGYND